MLVVVVVSGLLLVGFQMASLSDGGDVGAKASDFVKGPFVSILFEIDYFTIQPEIVPDRAEVQNFLGFVERYTGKTARVEYSALPDDLATTGHWDTVELRALDSKVRNTQSWPFYQLSVHVIYANALFEPPGNDVAGISIDATTIVVFKGLFAVTNPDAEDVLLAHEFGHLLGLCGLAMPDPNDMCDGAGHAKDPQSLMAALVDPRSPWVHRLELMPAEVEMLHAL